MNLRKLKRKVLKYASKIGQDNSSDLLPTFGYSEDFGRPHIEIVEKEYHLIVVERGIELECKKTFDLDELLYWIFEDVTFSLACDYESDNRVVGQDSRRILFKCQLELIRKIDLSFSIRLSSEHQKILEGSPFIDPSSPV